MWAKSQGSWWSLCCIAVLSNLVAASAAPATVLTFAIDDITSESDVPVAYGDNVIGDGTPDPKFHYEMGNGWTPNVAVEYATLTPAQSVNSSVLKWYGSDYSTPAVAYPNGDGLVAEIAFVPEPGYAVRVNSFDLSAYLGAYDVDLIRITDATRTSTLWSSSESNIGPAAETFTPAYTGAPGETLRLQFGSTWNVAFDNVNIDQVVPEPASLSLLALSVAAAFPRRRPRQ